MSVSVFIGDKTYVLAAKGRRTRNKYSGIGGHVESTDKNYKHAAFRELMEELFGIFSIDVRTIEYYCKYIINPYTHAKYKNHITYYMSFAAFEQLLVELSESGSVSEFYMYFPRSISEFFSDRIGDSYEVYDFQLFHTIDVLQHSNFTPEFKLDAEVMLKGLISY